MKRVATVVSLGLVLVVLGTALAGVPPTPAAAQAPGVSLTGWGTATMDQAGRLEEWDGAAQISFQAKLPDRNGGGTTPVTIFVMNDKTNLYLAAKIMWGRDKYIRFAFDNDHNSNYQPQVGDDFVELSDSFFNPPGIRFRDGYLFPTDGLTFDKGISFLPDDGPMGRPPWGTSDGAGAIAVLGYWKYPPTWDFVKISHPLNTADNLHDFSLHFGQTVGFNLRLQLADDVPGPCPADCYAVTYFPPTTGSGPQYGDIVIQSPYEFSSFDPPVQNLPAVNVATAGQTIPLKWSLRDRTTGQYVSDLGVVKSYGFQGSSCSPGGAGAIDTTVTASASDLRYSKEEKQIVLNWRTDPTWAGKCGMLTLTLTDGTEHKANFQFK